MASGPDTANLQAVFDVSPRRDILAELPKHCAATPVTGHPAMVQCTRYSAAESLLFQVGQAYEKATPWRDRRPVLDVNAMKDAAN